jgi:hypothetical protein
VRLLGLRQARRRGAGVDPGFSTGMLVAGPAGSGWGPSMRCWSSASCRTRRAWGLRTYGPSCSYRPAMPVSEESKKASAASSALPAVALVRRGEQLGHGSAQHVLQNPAGVRAGQSQQQISRITQAATPSGA